MKLEFVPLHEDEGSHLCLCNGHDYNKDYDTLPAAWLTSDGKRFYDRKYDNVPYLIQFPYTLYEYNTRDTHKYICRTCGKHPYRIIRNKDYR